MPHRGTSNRNGARSSPCTKGRESFYPPDAVWSGQDPPRASFLMHQLGGLNSRKFPRLDGKLFAAQVNSMLPATQQKTTAR
jgi:hypothetical protein